MPHIKIKQIALTPRNDKNGFIANNYEEGESNLTIEDIQNRMCVSLAGRIAQIKKYGSIEGLDMQGSADLQHAIHDAYMAITHYGMDTEVRYVNMKGHTTAQQHTHTPNNTQQSTKKIDDALERWMTQSEQKTIKLVEAHWEKIEVLSLRLLDKEILYEDDLEGIV
jgi:cell division protease FtsH